MTKPYEKQKPGVKNSLFETIKLILFAVILAAVLKGFIVDSRVIPSLSMYPTIDTSDRVIVNKLAYLGENNQPKHGDIVVFRPPAEMLEDDDLIKRVIGIPGDILEVADGILYINGVAQEEPYLYEDMNYQWGPIKVPEDCFVMMGDNRNHSNDAHLWANPFITEEGIVGRATYRYWPLSRFGAIDDWKE
ncbi:MAG: signal peptidase I [Clostridia bacterium]|nr:signal peptidase I [Clostridia bacterium]